jgi:hypothetical protein
MPQSIISWRATAAHTVSALPASLLFSMPQSHVVDVCLTSTSSPCITSLHASSGYSLPEALHNYIAKILAGHLVHVKCIHELRILLSHIPIYLHVISCYKHFLLIFQ